MTYVAGHKRGGGLGDDSTPTPILPGLTGSAGGTPFGLDPGAYLVAQVNRFAQPTTPAGLRVAAAPFPIATGKVGDGQAIGALLVLQLRALDAAPTDPGAAAVLGAAASHMADAAAYVNANVPMITQIVQDFADSQSLPKASVLETVSMTTWLAAGGLLVAAYLFFGSAPKRKGQR